MERGERRDTEGLLLSPSLLHMQLNIIRKHDYFSCNIPCMLVFVVLYLGICQVKYRYCRPVSRLDIKVTCDNDSRAFKFDGIMFVR